MRGSKKRAMQLLRSTIGEVCKMNEARRKEHEVKYVGFHDAWLACQPLCDHHGSGRKTAGTTRKLDSKRVA
jgi:hypothetical protein